MRRRGDRGMNVDASPRHEADGVARLLAGYQPPPGVSDELIDAQGNIRPVWRQFVDHVARLTPDDLAARFARGDQYLRDAGVYFRQYGTGDTSERGWPLAHIPVLLDEDEAAGIARGLIQRADLLEAVLADLYGPNRLVADGHLPASLIAGSREWLRPLVGIPPRGGNYLHFLAFEIGRGPDGTWWVLGDRTQAPSGAGFALENRVATARIFSDLYAEAHVHRLAGFFRTFRDALQGLSHDPEARIAILTPGPLNDTYFEHAWIARYLGFMLLEGEDLTVEDGRVMVRTVAGLRPVSVLWRRLDAAFADPLELDAGVAARHARPRRRGPRGLGHAGQRARLRHPGDPGAARLPAADLARADRAAADPAQHCYLVVRPAGGARARPRQQGPPDDRPGAVDAPALRARRHDRARRALPQRGPRLVRRLA